MLPTTLRTMMRRVDGTRQSAKLRELNLIPGIVYGKAYDAPLLPEKIGAGRVVRILVQTPLAEITKQLEVRKSSLENTVYELELFSDVDPEKKVRFHVVPRGLHLHPVTDRPLSLNFLITPPPEMDKGVRVKVPFVFLDTTTCPGVRRGGVLNRTFWEMPLIVKGHDIPKEIIVSVASMDLNSRMKWSDLPISKNPNVRLDPSVFKRERNNLDPTIATIRATRTALKSQKDAAAAAAAAGSGSEDLTKF